jgi:hypothetical protein
MITVEEHIELARSKIRATLETRQWLKRTDSAQRDLIAYYTAAIAVNFTDWMGKALPWVRHELAQFVLKDNLRCEAVHDHIGMLYKFAKSAGADIDEAAYSLTILEVERIRELFREPNTAGLAGLALITALENTSIEFIPMLEAVAKNLGVTDLQYTKVHGEADAEHSNMFVRALKAELTMGYPTPRQVVSNAFTAASSLLEQIFN